MANITERELQKQIGTIKRYAEIGKVANFDTDYEFLKPISRTLDDIQVATGKIEQGHKKRHYALFWMVNNTQYDEIAFNNLNDNNTGKAIDIWEKTLKTEVTEKNYSSYLNISTLYAVLSVKDSEIDLAMLQKSFEIKSQVLNDSSLKLLSELISINSRSIDTIEISKRFVDETYDWLGPYIDKPQGITVKSFINLFKPYPKNIRTYLSDRFIAIPLSNIETNVDKTKILRKEDPHNSAEFGQELYDTTIEDLNKVKSILGVSNTQYQLLENKLATEILQCAIEFYNIFRDDDSDYDPGDEALRLCIITKSIGVTGRLIERIEDTTKTIQEWVDGKSEREHYLKIKNEIDYIYDKITLYDSKPRSIEWAANLIKQCLPKLLLIKKVTGSLDENYIAVSDAVVNRAFGTIINVLNKAQGRFNSNDPNNLETMSKKFTTARSLLSTITQMDMSKEIKKRINTNTATIVSVDGAIKRAEKQKSKGCYIATMAYGSYEHPQVLILRQYRDYKLSRSILGRAFIKIYYSISPYLVGALKDNNQINKLIRYVLDIFVRSLKI